MNRTSARIAAVTAAALVATGTAAGADAKAGRPSLDGVWQMDGYGLVLDVKGSTLTSYETTAISCLPEFTATATGGGCGGAAFRAVSAGSAAGRTVGS
ncbi:hypothetical protein ABH935_001131 [Catenulispora sp. GAS73]|uniref:hypothetical protein n=1 Tax=Catenulispora sp. GAS73 TaxID=3156269 RepID=UPI00351695DE